MAPNVLRVLVAAAIVYAIATAGPVLGVLAGLLIMIIYGIVRW